MRPMTACMLTLGLAIFAGCGGGPNPTLSGEERQSFADEMVQADPLNTGEIPPANSSPSIYP